MVQAIQELGVDQWHTMKQIRQKMEELLEAEQVSSASSSNDD
jgi:hypothetical protein